MLCEDSFKIGFLGSSYFIGVVSSMLIIPTISDIYGRRKPIIATLCIILVTQYLLIQSKSINETLILVALRGVTFSGKNVVMIGYITEQLLPQDRNRYINLYCFADPMTQIL